MTGSKMRWILDNPDDIIQKILISGRFYERDYLDLMHTYCPKDATILDLGANVGNHTVYFSKFFEAKKIYSIEPLPRAYRMLLANIALNYCHNVNVDYIGLAMGDRECMGYPITIYGKDNLGSTMLNPNPLTDVDPGDIHDPVKIVRGDMLFKDEHVDFIKMDIESMEIVALAGLSETISRCRPAMFIEVVEDNQIDFAAWVEQNQYKIVYCDRFPQLHANYMVIPQ